MSWRWAKLSAFFIIAAIGVFLWWYNRPPSINEVSIHPTVANVGEEITVYLSTKGAHQVRVNTDLDELSPFTRTDVPGEFVAVYVFRHATEETANLTITAARGWWGKNQVAEIVSINRPPVIRDQVVTLNGEHGVTVELEARDPDGDSCLYSIGEQPSYGSLHGEIDELVYEPGSTFEGYDWFRVQVEDEHGGRASALIEIVKPPDFFGSYQTLSEIFQAPPTDIYGSTVNLWQFAASMDGNYPISIITGHAEHLTCQQASAAAATAWLMLPQEEANVLSAGFGYLTVKEPLNSAEGITNDACAPLYELGHSFDFLRDMTGLAQVYSVATVKNYNNTVDLISRYAGTFSGQTPLTVRLRLPASGSAKPIVVPFFLLNNSTAQYLEITLPYRSVLGESFTRLQEVHMEQLKHEMIAEKERLRDTYRKWAQEDKEEKAQLEYQKANNGEEWLKENGYLARWTRDYKTGKVVPLDPPQWTSYEKRLEQLPGAIEHSLALADRMDELLQELSQLLETGRLQALNDGILIDCFLRGWELPFEIEEVRSLYEQWLSKRSVAWASIYRQLTEQDISCAVISHGNTVFRIKLEDNIISIVPYFVLDAADCAIDLDPDAGVIQYVNWWEKRELESAYSSVKGLPTEALASLAQAQIAISEERFEEAQTLQLRARWEVAWPTFEQGQQALSERYVTEATQYFREAITIAPLGTASNLLRLWWNSFPEPLASCASYQTIKETARETLNLAHDIGRKLEASAGKTEAERLLTALSYMEDPRLLDTYAVVFDLLTELVDEEGSSPSKFHSLIARVGTAEQRSVSTDYLSKGISLIAEAFDDLIQRVQLAVKEHQLEDCMSSMSGLSGYIANADYRAALQAIESIESEVLKEPLQHYLKTSYLLHQILSYNESAPSFSGDLLDYLRKGGNLSDYRKQHDLLNTLRESECTQLRRELLSGVDSLKQQLKKSFGITNWPAASSLVEELQSKTNAAFLMDYVAWEELAAQKLFRLALESEEEEAAQHGMKALELAEQAALAGLRLGVLEPFATWVEMEWRSGRYRRALSALFASERPLCLLSSQLHFSELNEDTDTFEELTAREERNAIVCYALPEGTPILRITGFKTPEDRDALREQIDGLSRERVPDLEDHRLTQDLLATPFSLLPSTKRLQQAIALLDPLFLKSLAYGWYITDELIPINPRYSSFLTSALHQVSCRGSTLLDESQYLPALLTVENAEELAQLPRAIVVDPDLLQYELSGDTGALIINSIAPVSLLTPMPQLAKELPTTLEAGRLSVLRERFPFIRTIEELESGGTITFCEVEGQHFAFITTLDGGKQSFSGQPLASLRTPSAQLMLVSAYQASELIVQELDAQAKYSAWQWNRLSALCLKLGDTIHIATNDGLLPLPEDIEAILRQPSRELDRHQWEVLIDELFPSLLEYIDYEVTWEADQPKLKLELSAGEWFFVDVPADHALREMLWMALKGNSIVWVAESSNSLAARRTMERALLELDVPLDILISCPTEYYQLPNIRDEWDRNRDRLIARIQELCLPIKIHDISNSVAVDAVHEVQELLSHGESQVLGFFHRADSNSFEVGQGGRFGKEEIGAILASGNRDRFLAILGCEPLLYGLNDAFIENDLTSSTLTVGEELSLQRVFEYLSQLLEQWGHEASEGKRQVPIMDVLPDFDVSPMAEEGTNAEVG